MSTRALLSAFFLLITFSIVNACTCPASPSVEEAIKKSKAVFSGTVMAKLREGVKFKVHKVWKGVALPYVYIYTGNIRNDCDAQFEKGESWVVYANQTPLYKTANSMKPYVARLMAKGCSRTSRLMEAEEDLKLLGTVKKP